MHDQAPPSIWRRSRAMYEYPGPARLVSWSEVQAPLAGHETHAPYIVAIVRLDDGSARTAQLADCTTSELTAGLELTPVFRRIYDTGPTAPVVYGYKFTPKRL